MKRNLQLIIFAALSMIIGSVNAQNKLDVSLSLNGTGNYPAAQNKYGVDGSSVTVTLTVTPRDVKASTELVEEEFVSSSITRTYNNQQTTISGTTDSFTPVIGLDQKASYQAELKFRSRSRAKNTDNWSAWTESTENVTTSTSSFSIYSKPGDVSGWTTPNAYTYVGGKSRSFSIQANQQSGNPTGWKATWYVNDPEVGNGYTYTYEPKDQGQKVVKVWVVNYAPDNETIWYQHTESFELTVYTAPKAPEITKPQYMSTTVGIACDDFKMNTHSDTGNPNGWTYEWNGVESTSYTVDVSKEDQQGISIQAHWKNVNPSDPTEVWLDESSDVYTYKVYPKLEQPQFEQPSNRVLTVDSVANYKVTASGGYAQGWTYKWTSSTTSTSSTNSEFAYKTTNDAGKQPVITCEVTNTAPDGSILYSQKKLMDPLAVYSKPQYSVLDIHQNSTHDADKYAIYLGQDIDASQLYTAEGGFTNGWTAILSVDGNQRSNLVFKPEAAGTYKLNVAVKNIAKLTDGSNATWSDNSKDYELTVYAKPDTITNLAEMEGDAEYHILKEESVTLKVTVQGGDETAWSCNWTPEKANDQSYYTKDQSPYTYYLYGEPDPTKDSRQYDITGTVTNNPRNIVKGCQYECVIKKTIVVWKEITAYVDKLVQREDEYYVIESCEGIDTEARSAINFAIKTGGGNSSKWEVTYTPMDASPAGTMDFNKPYRQAKYTLPTSQQANGELSKELHYHAIANYDNGKTIKEFDIAVIVWPAPSVKDVVMVIQDKPETQTVGVTYPIEAGKNNNVVCYWDDTLNLRYTLSGGKSDEPGLWTCSFATDETTVTDNVNYETSNVQNYTGMIGIDISKSAQQTIQFHHVYRGKYYSNTQDWYASSLYFVTPSAYKKPEVAASLKDSTNVEWGVDRIDVYEGNGVNLKYVCQSEGNPDGWKYEWYVDDNRVSTDKESWTYTPTTNSAYEDKVLKVHITNEINGNYGLNETHEFPIRVWKKASIPSAFVLTDTNQERNMTNGTLSIREGNSMHAQVNPIQYGYTGGQNTYTYTWTNVSPVTSSTLDWNLIMSDKNETDQFGVTETSYSLKVNNVGPYGKIWDGTPQTTQKVRIYNRPKTPTQLMKKGNGSSGTMICSTDVTDTDLEGHKYYLVFGYEDANGGSHDVASQEQTNPGSVRWGKSFTSAQTDKAYVYAVWKQDNVEVTSGKRYVNTVDEVWDGSTYDGSTRAAIAGESADAIDNVEISADSNIRVYSVNGVYIGSDIKSLHPGLYVIERETQNGEKITQKVMIK